MKKRYLKNMNMLSEEEIERLGSFRVCVIGCGGLGGYVIELLGRLGIGYITAVDGDVFDETNLNRQMLSTEAGLGKSKAAAAMERMKAVNSDVTVCPVQAYLNRENGGEILRGHHIAVDALDNVEARLLVEQHCETLGIPFVHGAIAGWYGQVTTVMPGDRTLERLYLTEENRGDEMELGNPSFSPALVASIEVSEVLKVLLKRGELLRSQLLTIDLLNQEYEKFDL